MNIKNATIANSFDTVMVCDSKMMIFKAMIKKRIGEK